MISICDEMLFSDIGNNLADIIIPGYFALLYLVFILYCKRRYHLNYVKHATQ